MTKKIDFSKNEKALALARKDPKMKQLIKDAYLKENTVESANDFKNSQEFEWCAKLLEKYIQNKETKLLDCGGGTGINSYALANLGFDVSMLEIDDSNICGIGAAKKLLMKSNCKFKTVKGDAEDIPFSNNYFDVVFCRQVLHHASDLEKMIKEMIRVLKPGGLFVALREHAIKKIADREIFRKNHPFAKYGTYENAFLVADYFENIKKTGISKIDILPFMIDFDGNKNKYILKSSKFKLIKPLLSIFKLDEIFLKLLWLKYKRKKLRNILPGEEITIIGIK